MAAARKFYRIVAGICVLAVTFGAVACLPRKGTPVFVEKAAVDSWSGKGVLTEVSPDQRWCRVIYRDATLMIFAVTTAIDTECQIEYQ